MELVEKIKKQITLNSSSNNSFNINNIKHNIKRYFQKRSIETRKGIDKNSYTHRTEFENNAVCICRNLIKRKGTTLLGNYITQERDIDNEELDIHIMVTDTVIEICAPSYSSIFPICKKSYDKICRVFDGHQDVDRKKMHDKRRAKMVNSLDKIYNEVNNLNK